MSGCKDMDTQEHCVDCEKNYPSNTRNQNISYSDIHSIDITKQAAVTKLFATLLERREVASANSTGPQYCPELPGECSGHCENL